MDDHDKDGQQKGLVFRWHIVGVGDRAGSENHGSKSIVHRWGSGHLYHPVRPAGDPSSKGSVSRRCEDSRCVIESTTTQASALILKQRSWRLVETHLVGMLEHNSAIAIAIH